MPTGLTGMSSREGAQGCMNIHGVTWDIFLTSGQSLYSIDPVNYKKLKSVFYEIAFKPYKVYI